MDNTSDNFHYDIVKMHSVNLSCFTCGLYCGDYEDTGNGFQIVHCEDGKSRCAWMDSGCSYYEEDMFADVKDVN